MAQFVAEARHQLVRRLPPEKRASQLAWLDQLTARRGGGDAASAVPAQDNSPFPPPVGPETKKGSPMVRFYSRWSDIDRECAVCGLLYL